MKTKQSFKELKRRRLKAARLLERGVRPAEVARTLEVSRQSVMRWQRALESEGIDRIARVGTRGRPRQLSDLQLKELAVLLKAGSLAAGYATEMWTVPRISALIQERFGVKLVNTSVWRTLQRMGWSVQRPARQARQRNEEAISTWKRKRWPELKKSLRDSDESSSS